MNNTITFQNTGYQQTFDINGEPMVITPLGAGSEVGRSCIIIKFQEKNIMLDCGIHPAYTGISSLPYFDEIDPSAIDLLLVTHFHLDHCGALPYFLEKTNFQGDCYMTHPTKANYKLIIKDYIKISHVSTEESLFDEKDLNKSLDKINVVDYHQEINVKGIKFIAYNAGHVLGSAMFLIEISGVKVLYTGDYSREIERHLKPAEIPKTDIHVLIVESTYGIHQQAAREDREKDFTKFVDEIVSRGGKCLLPVFATGRVQELLLILDEYWEAHPQLKDIKIYYASSMASNSFEIFKTYINMAGDYIKNKVDKEGKNPFDFQHITCVKTVGGLDESKPVVVFASPGFMQSGLSKTLFQEWCSDSKNGIIITGYCVEGTLARFILGEPPEIKLDNGTYVMRMTVRNVTFSAHSDFAHTNEFIQILKPKNIILVHGEGKEMERLRLEYERLKHDNEVYKQFMPRIFNPKNCQKIIFGFKLQKKGFIVGNLSERIIHTLFHDDSHFISSENAKENNDKMDIDNDDEVIENYIEVSGLLLEEDNLLMDKNDIDKYSNLQVLKFKQILTVKYTLCKEILLKVITDYFQEVTPTESGYKVCEKVDMKVFETYVVLEWYSDGFNDLIANSLAMTITQLESNPSGEMYKHYENRNEICSLKKNKLINYLKCKYSKVEESNNENCINSIFVYDDNNTLCEIADPTSKRIITDNEELKQKVIKDLEFFDSL